MIGFRYIPMPNWPPLAWLATWHTGDQCIKVMHGNRVETESDWFGEVVWDGEYTDNRFDETDIVFGSAARLVDNDVVFVSASHTLDRLVSATFGDEHFVSNSIVCLSAISDSTFDPWYPNYPADFKSVINGPEDFKRDFDSSRGPINLTYFKNLAFNGKVLVEVDKPRISRERNSLAKYREFMDSSLKRCCSNLRHPARNHKWDLMSTISTGFDSATVSALGCKHGLRDAITITSARGGGSDSGVHIGRVLGLEVHEIDRPSWECSRLSETLFLAADAKGEDVYFQGAGDLLKGRVLMTGYTGSLWGGRSKQYLKWKRTDQSGLSFSEYRLHVGAINMPVPSIGVYEADDLLDLMSSREVTKWASGKSYDKPFCRIILSEAGVPDDLYGIEKKAASVLIEDRSSFLSAASRDDFEAWLDQLFLDSPTKALSFRIWRTIDKFARKVVSIGMTVCRKLGELTNSRLLKRVSKSVKLSEYSRGEPNYRFLFPWAMEHAIKRYL